LTEVIARAIFHISRRGCFVAVAAGRQRPPKMTQPVEDKSAFSLGQSRGGRAKGKPGRCKQDECNPAFHAILLNSV
jgi:hypothetical protein